MKYKKGFYKLVSKKGKTEIIELKLDNTKKIVVTDCIGRWGFVESSEIYFPFQYEYSVEIITTWDTIISNKFFFMDQSGCIFPFLMKSAISPQYNQILYASRVIGGWEFNNNSNKRIIHFHDVQGYFHSGRIMQDTTSGFKCFDKSGILIFKKSKNEFGHFKDGLARFYRNDKIGFLDVSGKSIIESKFEDAWNFSEGLAPVKKGDKWGYINQKGETIIEFLFNEARNFSEGMARISFDVNFSTNNSKIQKTGLYGFINKTGKLKISPRFEYASDFCGGMAKIKSRYKFGFINKKGEIVIPSIFVEAESFSDGFALVRKKTNYGFINN
ncbi:MAG: WG repeat-containing protein [Pseudomonadota bacterium]